MIINADDAIKFSLLGSKRHALRLVRRDQYRSPAHVIYVIFQGRRALVIRRTEISPVALHVFERGDIESHDTWVDRERDLNMIVQIRWHINVAQRAMEKVRLHLIQRDRTIGNRTARGAKHVPGKVE